MSINWSRLGVTETPKTAERPKVEAPTQPEAEITFGTSRVGRRLQPKNAYAMGLRVGMRIRRVNPTNEIKERTGTILTSSMLADSLRFSFRADDDGGTYQIYQTENDTKGKAWIEVLHAKMHLKPEDIYVYTGQVLVRVHPANKLQRQRVQVTGPRQEWGIPVKSLDTKQAFTLTNTKEDNEGTAWVEFTD